MKTALFYHPEAEQRVRCELCPHTCVIADGRRGICGVRENRQGTLYSLVYGKVVASHVDPIEKKPLFHFLPGSYSYSLATVGCNFKCSFCQNFQISQVDKELPTIYGNDLTPEELVAAALERECQSISYTYTEPTVYFEFAYDCAKLARERGMKNIFVTNGYTSLAALDMIKSYLDAANVDLKSFREDFYHKYCGAKLSAVLASLKYYKRNGIWLEVTTLVIPGLNDSPGELTEIANFIKGDLGAETPWHVSAFYPTHKMLDREPTPPETLTLAREIGLKAGLKYVYSGNIPIKGEEDTYCPKCGATVIQRTGFQVVKNGLKRGGCGVCGEAISGVWS